MRTSQTTRALKRAVTALAAVGALALGGLATSAPAAAAKAVTIDKATVTSQSSTAWSSITINAQWSVQDPAKGDTITIKLGDGLHWGSSRLDFKLTSQKDPGLVIGSCTADRGANVLACTLNDKVEQWDSTTGNLEAYAQFTNQMIGKDKTSLDINGTSVAVIPGDTNGDGTCDKDCGPVHPEPVSQSTRKDGWLSKYADGTYTWDWVVNLTGSTEYTVTDKGAEYTGIQCTNNTSWVDNDPKAVTPKVDMGSNGSLKVTVTEASTVCRLWFTSTTSSGSATNTATVNGTDLPAAKATASAMGSGTADGSVNPTTPPAAPAPTTGAPSASATPSVTPTCTMPSGSTGSSASANPSQGSECPSAPAPKSPAPKSPAPGSSTPTTSAPEPTGTDSSDAGNQQPPALDVPQPPNPGNDQSSAGSSSGAASADQGAGSSGTAGSGNKGGSANASTTNDPVHSGGAVAASNKPGSGNGGGLASTGASIAIGGIAVVALLGGGGALYLARRRRA